MQTNTDSSFTHTMYAATLLPCGGSTSHNQFSFRKKSQTMWLSISQSGQRLEKEKASFPFFTHFLPLFIALECWVQTHSTSPRFPIVSLLSLKLFFQCAVRHQLVSFLSQSVQSWGHRKQGKKKKSQFSTSWQTIKSTQEGVLSSLFQLYHHCGGKKTEMYVLSKLEWASYEKALCQFKCIKHFKRHVSFLPPRHLDKGETDDHRQGTRKCTLAPKTSFPLPVKSISQPYSWWLPDLSLTQTDCIVTRKMEITTFFPPTHFSRGKMSKRSC